MTRLGAACAPLAVLALCWGCHPTEDSTRDEARALLGVLGQLEADAPVSQRKAGLDELRRLTLHDAELQELRRLCMSAHVGLLEVQMFQAEARSLMAQAEVTGADRAGYVGSARHSLQRAEASLAAARKASDACQARSRTAAERYR